MIENGIIFKVTRGGYAIVRLSRKTACENCKMCMMPRKEMYVQLKIRNTEGFKEGDYVSISMPEKAILKASFFVYLLPIVAMTIVLFFTYSYKLWISLSATITSVILVFIFIALLDKFVLKKRSGFIPLVKLSSDISEKEKIMLKQLLIVSDLQYEDELGKYDLEKDKAETDHPKKD